MHAMVTPSNEGFAQGGFEVTSVSCAIAIGILEHLAVILYKISGNTGQEIH
jgi:hypothetical protein